MKTIYQYLILSAILLIPFAKINAQDLTTGDLKVTVVDEKGQPMPGAIVMVVTGGSTLGGATNLDGNFTFRALNPGTYNVEARMSGYKKYVKQGILVNVGQTSYASYPMQPLVIETDSIVTITAVRSPVEITFSTVKNINADQLKNSANGRSDLLSLIEGSSSDLSLGKGGQLVMRGSREGASTMFVDGEKIYGDAGVPGGSIEQVTVLSGGIPAAYGDMTGGVIIITTKTFESGFAGKQAMYDAAAESEAAAKKAAAEKSGQLIDKDGTIIEKQQPPVPVPQTPVPDGGGN